MRRLLDHDDLRPKGIKKSKSQLYRDGRAGMFPLPVRHGSRNLWVEEEIDAWIAARIAERDARVAERRADDPKKPHVWPVKGESARAKRTRAATW